MHVHSVYYMLYCCYSNKHVFTNKWPRFVEHQRCTDLNLSHGNTGAICVIWLQMPLLNTWCCWLNYCTVQMVAREHILCCPCRSSHLVWGAVCHFVCVCVCRAAAPPHPSCPSCPSNSTLTFHHLFSSATVLRHKLAALDPSVVIIFYW